MGLQDWYYTHPFGVGPRSLVVVYVGLTGGGQYNLDGEPTQPVAVDGTESRFVIESSTTASMWQLVTSTHIDDPANGWKRPLDYHDTVNAKVWKRVSVFGTGNGGGGGDGLELLDVQAAEDIPAYTFITVTGFKANSNNIAHYGKVIGIVQIATLTGFIASAVDEGEIQNPTWTWTPGAKLFINGTSISTTPPASGFSQKVAVAENANTIIVGLEQPVLL
jgi:hypothetical protein